MELERIEAAAIRSLSCFVISLPRPARHHDVIAAMRAADFTPTDIHSAAQGFVTSAGRFVNRREGVLIAQAAGQLLRKSAPADELFSEDVW